jgi:hypothetical protein
VQVIGLGAQDDFPYAREFLESGGLATPTLLWDPSLATWQAFGVRANSQMMVVSPDLTQGSSLIYGFDESQREAILDLVGNM